LKIREGRTLCHGSWRVFLKPLTTSRPSSSAARNRGISRAQFDEPDRAGMAGGQFGGPGGAAVAGAVVDEDHLEGMACRPGRRGDLRTEIGERRLFVDERDHERDRGGHGGTTDERSVAETGRPNYNPDFDPDRTRARGRVHYRPAHPS